MELDNSILKIDPDGAPDPGWPQTLVRVPSLVWLEILFIKFSEIPRQCFRINLIAEVLLDGWVSSALFNGKAAVLTCTTVDWGERRTVVNPKKGNLPASRIWLRSSSDVSTRAFFRSPMACPDLAGKSPFVFMVGLCLLMLFFQLPSLNRARHPRQCLRGRGRFFPPMPRLRSSRNGLSRMRLLWSTSFSSMRTRGTRRASPLSILQERSCTVLASGRRSRLIHFQSQCWSTRPLHRPLGSRASPCARSTLECRRQSRASTRSFTSGTLPSGAGSARLIPCPFTRCRRYSFENFAAPWSLSHSTRPDAPASQPNS